MFGASLTIYDRLQNILSLELNSVLLFSMFLLIYCIILIFCATFFSRMPIGNKSGKGDETDPIKPVYVGEFPQVVRDEQTRLLQKRSYG